MLIAACALRHDADEGGFRVPRADQRAQLLGEQAVVIRRDGRRAEVVHRVVRQHGDGPAVRRLRRQQGQPRIGRPRRPDGVRVLVAGMHVGADGHLAKRIGQHLVGAADPDARVRVLRRRHDRPADAGRAEIIHRTLQALHDAGQRECRIIRVGIGAEASHQRRRAVGVRGREHDSFRRNAGDFLRA